MQWYPYIAFELLNISDDKTLIRKIRIHIIGNKLLLSRKWDSFSAYSKAGYFVRNQFCREFN